MDELKRRPKVNPIYLMVIVVFTFVGFFVGNYYAEKKFATLTEPEPLTKYFPVERHIESLKLMTGWENPETELIDDLVTKPEIIPVEPVLGGTMGFHDRDGIHLLNDKWVMAWFEDGHIGGYLILEFEIRDGNVDWKVIGSYLE